jgi:serine/threonine-protein kinase
MAMPERIGRYRVLGLVGQGAMGVVYHGRDDSLDRDLALKLMKGASDAESRARFLREARSAARLQHPNIVTIFEAGEHDGAPFMAMELLEGVDLQRAIEAGLRPDPAVTLPIVLQLLAGLGHAHEHGIVHRDVKPSNLFLPRGRPAKIMDFGVARLAGGTAATGIVGTPNYMSPEQARGTSLDGRSDLFSAGLILYELVTGEKAYRGDSIVALLYKIAHEDADLSLLPRGARWERLRSVLTRALKRNPEERYPDARAMRDELTLALQDLGGAADWSTASDRGLMVRATAALPRPEAAAPAPPTSVAPPPAEAAPPPAPAHGSRIALALAAVASLAVFATGAWMLARSGGAPAATPATSTPAAAPSVSAPPTMPVVRTTPTPAATPLASPTSVARTSPSPRATPSAETEPSGGTDEVPVVADGRIDRANDMLEKGRYAAALAEARGVLRREPGNAEAKMIAEEAEAAVVVETRLHNAQAALKRGDRETAMAEVKAGLAVSGNDARLLALFRELTQ